MRQVVSLPYQLPARTKASPRSALLGAAREAQQRARARPRASQRRASSAARLRAPSTSASPGYSSPPSATEPTVWWGSQFLSPLMPTRFLSASVTPVFLWVLSFGRFTTRSARSTVSESRYSLRPPLMVGRRSGRDRSRRRGSARGRGPRRGRSSARRGRPRGSRADRPAARRARRSRRRGTPTASWRRSSTPSSAPSVLS